MTTAGSCPRPFTLHDTVQLAHGAGGGFSQELMRQLFLPHFRNPMLESLDDQARFDTAAGTLAFTTDAHVVDPLFFPGGSIGELAVYGTVNDLAVGGATPLFLSAAFVLEEGLPLRELERVVVCMADAARRTGVKIVTGDTKVVRKGECDGLFIITSGIGRIRDGIQLSSRNLQPGDALLVSGSIAEHGMAIMTARHSLSIASTIISDCAPVHEMVAALMAVLSSMHAMRDPTRGGVAAALNELAVASGVGIVLDEPVIPVRSDVAGACELLGLNPLHVACEGRFVLALPESDADCALEILRQFDAGQQAARIGTVTAEHPGMVVMKTAYGSSRIVELPQGEPLPRIC